MTCFLPVRFNENQCRYFKNVKKINLAYENYGSLIELYSGKKKTKNMMLKFILSNIKVFIHLGFITV